MSKAKALGYQKPYTPNNRADFRRRKRGRNPADRAKPGKDTIIGTKPDTCVSCGCVIPEGRLQCPNCEGKV